MSYPAAQNQLKRSQHMRGIRSGIGWGVLLAGLLAGCGGGQPELTEAVLESRPLLACAVKDGDGDGNFSGEQDTAAIYRIANPGESNSQMTRFGDEAYF